MVKSGRHEGRRQSKYFSATGFSGTTTTTTTESKKSCSGSKNLGHRDARYLHKIPAMRVKKTFPVLYESTEKLNSAGRADEACEQASRAGRRSGAQGLCERMPTSPARMMSSKSCTPRILLTKTELGVVAVHRNTSYVHIQKYVRSCLLFTHTHTCGCFSS